MLGPAVEALLEGAEYGTETEDVARSSDAAAAAGMRPPKPVDWAAAFGSSGRVTNRQRERRGSDDGGGRSGGRWTGSSRGRRDRGS